MIALHMRRLIQRGSLLASISLLPAAAQELAPQRVADQFFSVSGRVVSAADLTPLSGVTVAARGMSVITGADGEFVFEGLTVGSIYVRPTLLGYLMEGEQEIRILLSAKEPAPPPLTIEMVQAASVTGVVEDAEGTPLPGTQVHLTERLPMLAAQLMRPRGEATTNDKGEFSIVAAPGEYYVYATPKTQSTVGHPEGESGPVNRGFVGTFYPSSRDAQAAIPVSAFAGSSLTGLRLEIQESRLYKVRGRVQADERDIANLTRLAVQLVRASGPDGQPAFSGIMPDDERLTVSVKEDGEFLFKGVAPGYYTFRDVGLFLALASDSPVNVSDQDVDEVVVSVVPPALFAGKVEIEEEGHTAAGLTLTVSGNRGKIQWRISESGTFALPRGLSPGSYRVGLSGPDAPVVTQIAWPGSVNRGAEFEAAAPGSDRVVISASTRGATINGRVEIPPDWRTQGTVTISTPMLTSAAVPFMETVALGPGGAFASPPLAPGRYQVCAWREESIATIRVLSDPRFHDRLGRVCETVSVQLGVGERLNLKPISIADLSR